MSNIQKMLEEFKTVAELRAFAEAQAKTITQLTQKLQKFEEENKQMLRLVEGVVPIVGSSNLELEVGSDEEEIARVELRKLREHSMKRELMQEEARRVEIYAKILIQARQGNKPVDAKYKKIDSKELLALVESDADANKSTSS